MNRELYNEQVKMEYLNTFDNEDVREIIHHLFIKSRDTEKFYDKDLFSFDLNQIDLVMYDLNPTTLNSVANNKSRINMYIRWAIKNGRRQNNINPLQGTSNDWAEKFIDQVAKKHLSYSEVYEITEELYNDQDKALIQCIFEGISGYQLSELTSLKSKNINWNTNEITVFDSKFGTSRSVKVSNRCLKLIELAYKQEIYLSEDTKTEKDLIDYDGNIFKNAAWRTTRNKHISRGNLIKRIATIRDKYEFDEFNVTSISESGRIKMAFDLLERKERLEKEELALIGDQFNLSKTYSNGYRYYNTSVMKNYINKENLKRLYGLEVDI